jgi:hypothetical protein
MCSSRLIIEIQFLGQNGGAAGARSSLSGSCQQELSAHAAAAVPSSVGLQTCRVRHGRLVALPNDVTNNKHVAWLFCLTCIGACLLFLVICWWWRIQDINIPGILEALISYQSSRVCCLGDCSYYMRCKPISQCKPCKLQYGSTDQHLRGGVQGWEGEFAKGSLPNSRTVG